MFQVSGLRTDGWMFTDRYDSVDTAIMRAMFEVEHGATNVKVIDAGGIVCFDQNDL